MLGLNLSIVLLFSLYFTSGFGEKVEISRSRDFTPERTDLSSLPQKAANATKRGSCGCVLPFIYENRIYQVCSNLFGLDPWCATSGKESIIAVSTCVKKNSKNLGNDINNHFLSMLHE